jgi:hypothetical protein
MKEPCLLAKNSQFLLREARVKYTLHAFEKISAIWLIFPFHMFDTLEPEMYLNVFSVSLTASVV